MKKILFIGTPFFGYYKEIIKEMNLLGYSVDYYNDRPNENPIVKGLLKINNNLLKGKVKRYFDLILKETQHRKYDYIFILNCKVLDSTFLESLKESNQETKFIFYTWDSLKLYPDTKKVLKYFDKCYSFDLMDCDSNEELELLPLFYTNEYRNASTLKDEKYDLVSIATAHPNRYLLIKKITPFLNNKKIEFFSYLYIHPFQYIYNRVFSKEFKLSKKKDFQFKALASADVINKVLVTKAVLDIPHEDQTGLTMRTIECIGAEKKLITTNKTIKTYDFYNTNNVLIIDNNNFEEIPDFLKKPFVSLNKEIVNQYSISSWVKKVLR